MLCTVCVLCVLCLLSAVCCVLPRHRTLCLCPAVPDGSHGLLGEAIPFPLLTRHPPLALTRNRSPMSKLLSRLRAEQCILSHLPMLTLSRVSGGEQGRGQVQERGPAVVVLRQSAQDGQQREAVGLGGRHIELCVLSSSVLSRSSLSSLSSLLSLLSSLTLPSLSYPP